MFCPHCGNTMTNKRIVDEHHRLLECLECESELFVTISYYTGQPTVASWSRNEWRKEDGRWVLRS